MRPLYTYSARESPLHRLDPRTKLAFVVGYLVATFLVPQPLPLLPAIVLIIWIGGRISPREYASFLLLILPLVLGITIVHAVVIGDKPYVLTIPLGPLQLHFSAEGLRSGLVMAVRLATMGIAFTMFAMTTDPFHLGMALYRSGLPYKIAFMLAFALRLYPLIHEEFLTIQNALRARGSDALSSFNPLRYFPAVVTSAVPLSLSAIRRSQEMALTMELRGLSLPETLGIRRQLYREVGFGRADYAVLGCTVLGLLGLALWLLNG
jgi:energy-coupling factor transport system permease protein